MSVAEEFKHETKKLLEDKTIMTKIGQNLDEFWIEYGGMFRFITYTYIILLALIIFALIIIVISTGLQYGTIKEQNNYLKNNHFTANK